MSMYVDLATQDSDHTVVTVTTESGIIVVDETIKSLVTEYIDYVDDMSSGRFIEDEDRHTISSHRTIVHDELNRIFNTDRQSTNMYRLCREILRLCNT